MAIRRIVLAAVLISLSAPTWAASEKVELVRHWTTWTALLLFLVGYTFVVIEERTHLRKSVPMILTAGVLWILVSVSPVLPANASELLRHNVIEFAELFLFILAAVTFVNTMEERGVFDKLRVWLVNRGLSLRGVFWATGAIAFCMSPIADNLTTTLVVGAVAIAVSSTEKAYVVPACVNIVVAANAGGAFSPFGDITTLMVWQKGHVAFTEFFALFFPAVVNWLVPALVMSFAVPRSRPKTDEQVAHLLPGARGVVVLFLLTIAGTVVLHNVFHLPAAIGMMTGFGLLHLYGHFVRLRTSRQESEADMMVAVDAAPASGPMDVFRLLERVEWDTFMFFYGVILCVGALGAFGLLDAAATASYGQMGPTNTNIVVGLASAVFDNIPLMAAVLTVSPDMNHAQWLLLTLTTGVGGSLLSVGSAAGVALMGQARGHYTFMAHLKWTWAVALGYAASIGVHFLINGR